MVCDRLLLFRADHTAAVDDLRGGQFLLCFIAGKVPADSLLKIVRRLCADGQDRGEAKLTDHIDDLIVFVDHAGHTAKHKGYSFPDGFKLSFLL